MAQGLLDSIASADIRRGLLPWCPPCRVLGQAQPVRCACPLGCRATMSLVPPSSLLHAVLASAQIFRGEPIMTLDTKLTMALAGCSGSCSANRWHTLSVALPCFRATNPKTLQEGPSLVHFLS